MKTGKFKTVRVIIPLAGVITSSILGIANSPVYGAEEMSLNVENIVTESINDYKVQGCAIYISNQFVGFVENKQIARIALEDLLKEYTGTEGEVTVLNVRFTCPVEFKEEMTRKSNILSQEELQQILSKEKNGLLYTVKSGETWETLAEKFAYSEEELIQANPNATLSIDSQIMIPSLREVLHVESLEKTKYKEPVDFETEEIYSENYVKGQRIVEKEGEKGKSEVTAEVLRVDGEKKDHVIKSTAILEDPKDEVVIVGTRETAATGTFIVPTNGRLTSGFGARWGRFHYGIDIANSIGTPVKASDGGVIVTANTNGGSYGNYIDVDHQNGYITRYAHLNQIDVKVGQIVLQGEIIGQMGNTGRSTGPHLHFEVLINGENRDPQNYISL